MPETGLQKFTLKTQKYRLKTGVLGSFSLFFQPLEKASGKVPMFGKKSAVFSKVWRQVESAPKKESLPRRATVSLGNL